MKIQHHGAVNGVTGSCHQLHIDEQNSVLIDCGLFQGREQGKEQETEKSTDERQDELLSINFDISTVRALIVTHCHIDHVGRIPYLLAAGFRGPIYATTATAALFPLVIEDALKVGVTRNKSIINACLKLLKNQLIALDYKKWQTLELAITYPSTSSGRTEFGDKRYYSAHSEREVALRQTQNFRLDTVYPERETALREDQNYRLDTVHSEREAALRQTHNYPLNTVHSEREAALREAHNYRLDTVHPESETALRQTHNYPLDTVHPELVEGKSQITAKIKFQMAGHILGSAYVEIDIIKKLNKTHKHRVVFSGDLGAPYAPLLPAPKSPYRADTLIIESTYGDKNHQNRKNRTNNLQKIIEKAVADNGVVLIPAFSIGRTQELLYELEKIIHRKASSSLWQNIDIIIDSPMAAKFTEKYQDFKNLWDAEAKREIKSGRHPLSFEQLYTVNSHQEHMQTVAYLAKRNKPAIIIAASGMCSGGRIVNYLKQFLNDKTADVLFVGYQAQGTLGRNIQKYGTNTNKSKANKLGYVFIDGKRIYIKAGVHTISGYSAHADQNGLINFVKRMRHQPQHIKIVHGDENAKETLAKKYQQLLPNAKIEIAR